MKLDFCVSHNYTQRDLILLLHHHHHHDSVEIPHKTRYKQKQNETHYENITHFIHLTLKNTNLKKQQTLYVIMKIKGADNQWKG